MSIDADLRWDVVYFRDVEYVLVSFVLMQTSSKQNKNSEKKKKAVGITTMLRVAVEVHCVFYVSVICGLQRSRKLADQKAHEIVLFLIMLGK